MSEKVVLKRQVYLSVEQYNTLKSTGSVTVDGKTIEFSENDEYITPDTTGADITAVRQELLTEVQKKADTSYVDEQIESSGGGLYRHMVTLNINDRYRVKISFLSSCATLFDCTTEDFKRAIARQPAIIFDYANNATRRLCMVTDDGTGAYWYDHETETYKETILEHKLGYQYYDEEPYKI